MIFNLILIGSIALATILLTVLRGLFNLPKPETEKEILVRKIFIGIAILVVCLNGWLGVRTYLAESKAPFKLNRQQLSLSIKLNCNHCTDSDVDSIKLLPAQFTVNHILFGSSYLSCDFNRIATPLKISGPRAASSHIYYRSNYISFEDNKSRDEYLWDLNGKNVALSLPNEFNEIFSANSKQTHSAWWSGQLIVEIDKTPIAEGKLNAKKTYHDRPNFNFELNGLSKEEVEAKWGH